jgi:hypothetical protein
MGPAARESVKCRLLNIVFLTTICNTICRLRSHALDVTPLQATTKKIGNSGNGGNGGNEGGYIHTIYDTPTPTPTPMTSTTMTI